MCRVRADVRGCKAARWQLHFLIGVQRWPITVSLNPAHIKSRRARTISRWNSAQPGHSGVCRQPDQSAFCVGFAPKAESSRNAEQKRRAKKLPLLVGNLVQQAVGSDDNDWCYSMTAAGNLPRAD